MLKSTDSILRHIVQKFLKEKFDTSEFLKHTSRKLIETIEIELNSAISLYNMKRTTEFKPYHRNAIELSNVLKADLPIYKDIIHTKNLLDTVGKELHNEPYFREVWEIENQEYLLCNLLLLIYRTSMLTINKSMLTNPDGSRKVQISSAIEEMIFEMKLNGTNSICYSAFKPWLVNWKEEGFSEELFLAVQLLEP
ncbi:hypothetical protein IT418_04110 [bacterium]|nr:hypothetical protein [bacterium]